MRAMEKVAVDYFSQVKGIQNLSKVELLDKLNDVAVNASFFKDSQIEIIVDLLKPRFWGVKPFLDENGLPMIQCFLLKCENYQKFIEATIAFKQQTMERI